MVFMRLVGGLKVDYCVTTQQVVLSSSITFYDLRLPVCSFDVLQLASMDDFGPEEFGNNLKHLILT